MGPDAVGLKSRNIVLYLDLKCYDKWQEKAKELVGIANVKISSFMEAMAQQMNVNEVLTWRIIY